jgi:hypothetical protein
MPLTRKAAPTGTEYVKSKPDFVPEDAEESAFEEESIEPTLIKVTQRKGWDAADEVQKKVKSLGDFFSFDEDPALVAFVEGAPFDSYLVHWVDTKDGRRSYRCQDEGECPLCEVGDSPSAKFAFWVVEYEFKGEQVNELSRIMEVGTRLKNTLRDINDDIRKGGPLETNFFSAHRTGKKQSTQYHVARVKDRDLLEEWELDPQDGRTLLKEVEAAGAPRLYVPSVEDVEAAASYLRRRA